MRYKKIPEAEAKKKVDIIKEAVAGDYGLGAASASIKSAMESLTGMKESGSMAGENSPKNKLNNRMQNLLDMVEALQQLEKEPGKKDLTDKVLLNFALATGENGGTTLQEDMCNLAISTDYQYMSKMGALQHAENFCTNAETKIEVEELKIDAEPVMEDFTYYVNAKAGRDKKVKELQEAIQNADGLSPEDMEKEKYNLMAANAKIDDRLKQLQHPNAVNAVRNQLSDRLRREEESLNSSPAGKMHMGIQAREKQLIEDVKQIQALEGSSGKLTGSPTETQQYYLDVKQYNETYEKFRKMDDALSPFFQKRVEYYDLEKKSNQFLAQDKAMMQKYRTYGEAKQAYETSMKSTSQDERTTGELNWNMYLMDKDDLQKHYEDMNSVLSAKEKAGKELFNIGNALGGTSSLKEMNQMRSNARNWLDQRKTQMEVRANQLQEKHGVEKTKFVPDKPSAIPTCKEIFEAANDKLITAKADLQKHPGYADMQKSLNNINQYKKSLSGNEIENATKNQIDNLNKQKLENTKKIEGIETAQNGMKHIGDAVGLNGMVSGAGKKADMSCQNFLNQHEKSQHYADAFKQLQGINPHMNDKRRLFHRDSKEFTDMCDKLNKVMKTEPGQKGQDQKKALEELYASAQKYVEEKLKDGKSREGSAMRVARLTQAENIMKICKTAVDRMEKRDNVLSDVRKNMNETKNMKYVTTESLTQSIIKPKAPAKTTSTPTVQKTTQKQNTGMAVGGP